MKPSLVETVPALRTALEYPRERSLRVGLVPTMGALHDGHASLIRAARAETGFVVVSIFVNPTQFGPKEDFSRYPRQLEKDLQLCRHEEVDLVFAPAPDEVYPPGFCTFVEVAGLQDVLCGASRPGHFRGVATVVLKLLQMVHPDVAYFGQKDAQQVRIIEQMVRDLDVPVRLRICPIVRETDGLALSSRNQYLKPEERRQAVVLSQALARAQTAIQGGERSAAVIRQVLNEQIGTAPAARIDYAAVVNAHTLQPIERLEGEILIALAVRLGETRLIDNLKLSMPSP